MKFQNPLLAKSRAPKVLVVEDNRRIGVSMRAAISQVGIAVVMAGDVSDCLLRVQTDQPDLILLDSILPSGSGFAVCRRLLDYYTGPIILLLENDGELDREFGLQLGAARCIAKPLDMREIVATVKTLLNLPNEACTRQEEVIMAAELSLFPARFELCAPNRRVLLTLNELKLPRLLIEHPNEIVSRRRISSHMWPEEGYVETSRVSEMVRRIRLKLEVDPLRPKYLRGIKGEQGGYALSVQS